MVDTPIHSNYRFEIQFQEEEDDLSWRIYWRGKRQLTDDDSEALEIAIEAQRAHQTRDFRIVVYREVETRREPYHPTAIRRMSGVVSP